ncbi:DUF6894 family protein [Sphingomonas arenae]|uniref:DUF6894 family protein n=1 Tax=Sphingomonas arenae TaxID=2812555 RepID=UPI001966D53B|nr:hypothetical protein [Sphingomonas arenae]
MMAARYFYDLIEDDSIVLDDSGLVLDSPAEVQSEARRCAQWIAAGYHDGRRPRTAHVRVRDASGTVCLTVPIQTHPAD